MTGDPPLAPAVKYTSTARSREFAEVIVGCEGAPSVRTVTLELAAPLPAMLIARNLTVYCVASLSPVTEIGDVMLAGLSVVQFAPSSNE